ncbi:Uncharacterised protein [Anaerococcus octavius]|uniref:Polymerase nucleotidyl transferase domain-containing protein n=1 Tax=Anaerococcus octavius TaxID=54007 RepID=A0A380WSU8_9FIRM|nr:nucleotidyltransferase [Anaerococcus octavius]SUU92071.1 Uncharacterised protein [Anaerococcus octavius]
MVSEALEELGLKKSHEVTNFSEDTPYYRVKMKNNYGYEVKIFLQGSYANNTNVRKSSDIDIAIVQEDTFRTLYREGLSRIDYGFVAAPKKEFSFKDEVEIALRRKFEKDVIRKNKAIQINGNFYRKDADVVPSLRYRDYSNDYLLDKDNYTGGILIYADDGSEIINYPEQNIRNGIEKNKMTNYFFKKMVRIAKEIRYQMVENKFEFASKASSFGVECLLYNVPDELFTRYSEFYIFTFEGIVKYLYSNRFNINQFKEVNGIKNLVDDDPGRSNVYIKFIEELSDFYQYDIKQ